MAGRRATVTIEGVVVIARLVCGDDDAVSADSGAVAVGFAGESVAVAGARGWAR